MSLVKSERGSYGFEVGEMIHVPITTTIQVPKTFLSKKSVN